MVYKPLMILIHVMKEFDGKHLFMIHLIIVYLQKVLSRKSCID